MTPFKLTPLQKQIQDIIIKRQDRLIAKHRLKVFNFLKEHAIATATYIYQTSRFKAPDLSKLLKLHEEFYRAIVIEAYKCSKLTETRQKSVKKKLAFKFPDISMPKSIDEFEQIFKNRRYWARLKKASDRAAKKLQLEFQRKLKRAFSKIGPLLQEGFMTPSDVKMIMLEAPNATKPLIETQFRTNTTTYFGEAQVNFFQDDEQIIGFLFDSIRDTSRTDICKSRHGLIYRPNTALLTENTPACHFNCRSHLVPLANTPLNQQMLNDPSRDPRKVKVVPLPRGWRK